MNQLRILVVDDYPIIRHGLRTLLEARSGWNVCGEAAGGRAAFERVKKLKPQIILLTLGLPDAHGLELIPKILKAHPKAAILAMAEHESGDTARSVLSAGALGLVLKSDPLEDILEGVRVLARGNSFHSRRAEELIRASGAKEAIYSDPRACLTSRELQVLKLLAAGETNRRVAAGLSVSVRTVEAHRASLMRKLNLRSISDLIYFALRNRIVRI
jgi:DNA-binding NarL/FixJ family response regulator